MIPEVAVEAAAKYMDAVMDFIGSPVDMRVAMRAALEAAAPHILAEAKAEALEDAAGEVAFWNKAGADDDITQLETIGWLRDRAAAVRGKG